jgi:integrase
MATLKLTNGAVGGLPPAPKGKQLLYWDAKLPGFGVLVSSSSKSYVVQARVALARRPTRITLGPVGRFKDLDAARNAARDAFADMRSGVHPKAKAREAAAQDVTLRVTLDAFCAARQERLRPTSVAMYHKFITQRLTDWLDKPIQSISENMVRERHKALRAKVKAGGRGNGAVTANFTMVALSVVWNWASKKGSPPEFPRLTLPPNPVQLDNDDKFPVSRRTRMVPLEDLGKFYSAVDSLPNKMARDFVLLILFTGMRKNEAAALKWSEIDFTTKTIKLPPARTKGDRALALPMSSFVRDTLVARRAIGVRGDYVFPGSGASGHLEATSHLFAEIQAGCGIRVSSHDLRRVFVTVAEASDISWMSLKALVNHSLPSDVTSGYLQLSAERLRDPAQKVCDKLMQLCGIDAQDGVTKIA